MGAAGPLIRKLPANGFSMGEWTETPMPLQNLRRSSPAG